MQVIKCTLAAQAGKNKQYHVKQVCALRNIPKNAKYFDTLYIDNKSQDIRRTSAGVYYATELK